MLLYNYIGINKWEVYILKDLDSRRQEIITILETIIKSSDNKKLYPVFQSELMDVTNPKMTNREIQSILSLHTKLESVSMEVLVWIYTAIQKYRNDIPKVEELFEEQEIKQAKVFQIKRTQMQFPLHFKILDKLVPHEDYLLSLSIKTLNSMQENGVIQLNAEMQRESEITVYKGIFVSHISYNDNRADEISQSILSDDFHGDTIRLILIDDEEAKYEINQETQELIIYSGNIALIDGNHRLKGAEKALSINENLELKLPVIFSIGSVRVGQKIINQSEKRQPINKQHSDLYGDEIKDNIVRGLVSSDNIDKVYKFRATTQEINKGAGFVCENILSEYIKKYYDINGISKKQENNIKNWLVEFFNELADHFGQDFKSYQKVKDIRWNVSQYTFAGYIYLSSILQNKENWEQQLSNILDSIDFSIGNQPWKNGVQKPDKLVVKYFEEEVVKNVLG